MPLIIVGVKKIVEEKKSLLFTLVVAVSALSNFYFFYMIVLCTAIYVIAYLVSRYGLDLQKILAELGKILAYAMLGTAMAAVLVIPVLYFFISDSRTELTALKFLYPLEFYVQLPLFFFVPQDSYSLFMGFPSVILLSMFTLFIEKGNRLIKSLLLTALIILLIPAFGQIFNGFSYPSERWCWGFTLILCYVLAVEWNNILSIKTVVLVRFFLVLSGIFLTFFLVFPRKTHWEICAIHIGVFLLITGIYRFFEKKERLLAVIIIFSVVLNGSYKLYCHNWIDKCASVSDLAVHYNNEITEIKVLGDDNFYRFSGDNLTSNTNMLNNLSSPQFYWSISNSNIIEFRKKLCSTKNRAIHGYCGYDSHAMLETLACVKYFCTTDKMKIPYGFEITENGRIFKNKYFLPFGYCYDKYIALDEFEKLSELEKQEAILQCVVLDNDAGSFEKFDIVKTKFNSSKLSYEIIPDENIQVSDGKFIVKKENSSIKLKFSSISNAETYLILHNFNYTGRNYYYVHLNIETGNGFSRRFQYTLPRDNWYAENHDFILNLGYTDNPENELTITFDKKGTYSFDSLELAYQTFEDYPAQVARLRKNSLENVEFGINKVSGNIKLPEKKVLLLSIPYSKGWSAEVDGKPAELLRANIMNMGLLLEAGEHQIKLYYRTPFLKLGALVSAFAVALFIRCLWRK